MTRRDTITHSDNLFAEKEEITSDEKEMLLALPFLGFVVALHVVMIAQFFGW